MREGKPRLPRPPLATIAYFSFTKLLLKPFDNVGDRPAGGSHLNRVIYPGGSRWPSLPERPPRAFQLLGSASLESTRRYWICLPVTVCRSTTRVPRAILLGLDPFFCLLPSIVARWSTLQSISSRSRMRASRCPCCSRAASRGAFSEMSLSAAARRISWVTRSRSFLNSTSCTSICWYRSCVT